MDVPDWPAAPGDDYPALLAPAEIPVGLNAQKKAKRKRKQQAEQFQQILEAPVRLSQPQTAGASTVSVRLRRSCVAGLQMNCALV